MAENNSEEVYDTNKADLIRLKVNRANMIQTLKVDDDFLSSLMKLRLILYKDANEISQGRSDQEKARNLIDYLMTKKHTRKDWYIQFRNLLNEKNYKDTVIFLDSTIVKYKPKFVKTFCGQYQSHSQLISLTDDSQLTNSDPNLEFSKNRDMRNIYRVYSQKLKAINADNLDEKNLDPLLENLPSYVTKSYVFFSELASSDDIDDIKQLDNENEEFDSFRKFEILFSIYMTDPSSLNESLFLDTHIAYNILSSPNAYMHNKYYSNLIDKYDIDLLKFLKNCLIEYFKAEKILRLRLFKSIDELVYKLTYVMFRNEKYEYATELLLEYLSYLDFIESYLLKINTENNNLNHETLKSYNLLLIEKFNAYSSLLVAKLNLFDFENTSILIEKTNDLFETLNKNGQEVDCTVLNHAIGSILLEQGHISESFYSLNKALLTLNYQSEILIDVIGAASLCYSQKWQIAKAENLTIIAIQAAKYFYGRNHPKFIKSLLFYCYFSNEFIQDQTSIQIAQYTLNLAKKVNGYDSIEVADANRALSKALIINKAFHEEAYYECAQRAFKIAKEIYKINSPKMIAYKISLSLALQWKSVNSNIIEIKKVNINDAFNLAEQALESCIYIFSENNITTAKIYRLIGSIFYYMERDNDSENSNKISLEIFKNCLDPNELHYLIAKSSYGIFLKMIGKIDEALNILIEVVDKLKLEELNNIVGYCKWIPSIYENIYYCYRQLNSQDLAVYYQKQAENLRVVAFQKEYYRHDVLAVEMYRKPPYNLNEFIKEYIVK